MVGGVKGGRSTYGICFGVLSWLVAEGHAGEIDLSGLAAAFVVRYDDDEPGSPWSFVVHVDERGSERAADGARGDPDRGARRRGVLRLPWVSKPSELLDVRASPIEILDGPTVTSFASAVPSRCVRARRTRPMSRLPAGSPATTSPASSCSPTSSSSTMRRSRGSSAATAPSRARSTTRRSWLAIAQSGRWPEHARRMRTISPSTTSAYAVCS